MSFVEPDDEIQIKTKVMIDDLETLAPIADKALCSDVGGISYRLWFNRSLDAINIQPNDAFSDQKPTGKIGIRRLIDGLSFFFENSPVCGIPSDFVPTLQHLSQIVRKERKLFEKGGTFDPESLKLIFDFMKEQSISVENPLNAETSEHGNFCLWIKTAVVLAKPAATRWAGAQQETKYFLNIQTARSFAQATQQDKLGLDIDEDGRVVSVMTDGQARVAEEVEHVLFEHDGAWNVRLTAILRCILMDRGFQPGDDLLAIHALAIAKAPELVLTRWAALDPKPRRIKFMEAGFRPGPGLDCGGLTKHFFSDLFRALFDGRAGRAWRVDADGCPLAPPERPLDAALGAAVGELLSHIAEQGLTVGRALPDKFFALLRLALRPPPPADAAAEAEAARLEAARLLAGEYQAAIVDWLAGAGPREAAVAMLELAGEDGIAARPEPEQRARAAALLDALAAPYLAAAAAVRAGLRAEFAAQVEALPPAEVSRLVQGKAMDGEDIARRIYVVDGSVPPGSPQANVLREKVGFLQAHVRERVASGDAAWAERFLLCVTGQRALRGSTRIAVCPSRDGLCRAHTCTDCLEVPVTHETPPMEEGDVRTRFIRNLEMTMAETGFSLA